MITIEHLHKRYEEQTVLENVNVHIEKGSFVFLRGASGSGKSTLLHILYQGITDYTGKVLIDGTPLRSIPTYALRRKVATIFQSFELLPQKTAFENVALAGEVLGESPSSIQKKVEKRLDEVGLTGKGHRFPHELSGGEQQRVAIARALLNDPVCLLADEPTGNLDPETAQSIMNLLQDINRQNGITMVIVTHSDELAASVPHRLITIENGVVSG